MREKKELRLTVSVILSLVLAAAVFFGVLVVEMSRGVLSRERLQQTISSKLYPYQMIEQMETDILKILEKNALPASVLQRIWDEEELYRVFYRYSSVILKDGIIPEQDETISEQGKTISEQDETISGQDETISEQDETMPKQYGYDFERKLEQSIKEYLREQGVVNTDAITVSVNQTVSDISRIYSNYMYPSFLEKFYHFAVQFEQYARMIVGICLAVAILCFAGLWSMYRYKHHALEYAASGFLAAVLWNIPAVLLLGNKDWIAQSGIGPEYYRTLIEAFLQQGMWTGLMVLAIELLVFLLLCAWVRESRKRG